jgi:hypothetical protein
VLPMVAALSRAILTFFSHNRTSRVALITNKQALLQISPGQSPGTGIHDSEMTRGKLCYHDRKWLIGNHW